MKNARNYELMTPERALEIIKALILDEEEAGQSGNASLDNEQIEALLVAQDLLEGEHS